MSLRTKSVAAACAAVLTAGTALAGTASAASAAAQHGQAAPGAGLGHAAAVAPAARQATAVTPAATPPDAWCRGQGPNYFGWFGIAPGSSADGGVAGDLWWDAKGNASPAPMQVYTGNGGANQQWCEAYLGSGAFIFYSDYTGGEPQCLTVSNNGLYEPGQRVWAETCQSTTSITKDDERQLWYVCPRSGNSVSLEPTATNPSSVWLDVWGGSSGNGTSAFVPTNSLQIWPGNGQDNQRFTLYASPGEPGGLSYDYTTGIAGC
jgi:hypothetical protein